MGEFVDVNFGKVGDGHERKVATDVLARHALKIKLFSKNYPLKLSKTYLTMPKNIACTSCYPKTPFFHQNRPVPSFEHYAALNNAPRHFRLILEVF